MSSGTAISLSSTGSARIRLSALPASEGGRPSAWSRSCHGAMQRRGTKWGGFNPRRRVAPARVDLYMHSLLLAPAALGYACSLQEKEQLIRRRSPPDDPTASARRACPPCRDKLPKLPGTYLKEKRAVCPGRERRGRARGWSVGGMCVAGWAAMCVYRHDGGSQGDVKTSSRLDLGPHVGRTSRVADIRHIHHRWWWGYAYAWGASLQLAQMSRRRDFGLGSRVRMRRETSRRLDPEDVKTSRRQDRTVAGWRRGVG